MSDLRDKVAQALADYTNRKFPPSVFTEAADAVLAVLDLDTIRAESQVKALREVAAETERKRSDPGLVHLDVRYQGYYTGIRSGMESAMRLLRETADRIAREAGIETGESND